MAHNTDYMRYTIWGYEDCPHTLSSGTNVPAFDDGSVMADCERRFASFEAKSFDEASEIYTRLREVYEGAASVPYPRAGAIAVLAFRELNCSPSDVFTAQDDWRYEKSMTLLFPRLRNMVFVCPSTYAVFVTKTSDSADVTRKLAAVSETMAENGWRLLDVNFTLD